NSTLQASLSSTKNPSNLLNWQQIQQSVPRRADFEDPIGWLISCQDEEEQTALVSELQPYLAYSDVSLMCMQVLDAELRKLATSSNKLESINYRIRHANIERLLLAFNFPKRLTRQDRLLLQKTQPESDSRCHSFWSKQSEFYSQLQKKLMSISQLRKQYGKLWRRYLDCPLPVSNKSKQLCSLLVLLNDRVLGLLTNAMQLADFIMSAFESNNVEVGMAATPCVFHLVFNYSLDYGPLFDRLYQLVSLSGLMSPYRGRFYRQLDLILTATNISTARIAAFAKRLAALCLLAPCYCQPMLIGLVLNLLRRHKKCQYLVHRQAEDDEDVKEANEKLNGSGGSNEFSMSISLTEAEAASPGYSLWELRVLQRHWELSVGQMAKKINRALSVVEDFCDKQVVERDWDQVCEDLLPDCLKQAEALKESGYASDEEVDPAVDGDELLKQLDGWC
uniref:CBF domain-containing protein n=1 Tax=Macrostomum lignano TaxID=282301 RepID=A0A1I8HQ60_9PLAT